MKTLLTGAIGALFILTAHAELRSFTDTQGRVIEAEIVMFDARKDSVVVKRKGSKGSTTVPLKIFSDKDQAYIRKWSSNQDFLSNRKFEVDIKRIKKKSGEAGQSEYSSMARKYYNHSFNLVLNNKSTTDFSDIKMDYVVHYMQEHHINRNSEKEERQGVLVGGGSIASIPMRSKKEIMTDPITLQTYRESDYDTVWPDLDGEVEGIIIRLSIGAGDDAITREFRYPEGYDKPWTTKEKNVMSSIR